MVPCMLFVCTGNTCRSPMAEAIARHLLLNRGVDVKVRSAGVAALPGARASAGALRVMREMKLDLSDHRARQLEPNLIGQAGLVLTMTRQHSDYVRLVAPSAAAKVFTLAGYAGTGADVFDPIGGSDDAYRLCAGELKFMIALALDRFFSVTNGNEQ